MKTSEQIKQEAEAAFERGKNYHEKKEYDMAIKEYSEAIRLDPNFVLAYVNRMHVYGNRNEFNQAIEDFTEATRLDPYFGRLEDASGKCSFCGLPSALAYGLFDGNDIKICRRCIDKPNIIEKIKLNNETLYNKINEKISGGFITSSMCISEDWVIDFTSKEELRTRAREYVKPKPPEPVLINNIPIHKNQSMELLEGEIFKKHPEKDVEVSNLGRVKQGDCILEQYDPKNNGYLFVDIKSTSETFSKKVYRLVAETWLGRNDFRDFSEAIKSSRYNTVHHISNNGYDNRIKNLMWVTEWQHAMIHPWMDINKFNFNELSDLFYSYADINITPNDYQRIINIAKRMQQLENAESKFPGKYDYWYKNIIEAMEDLNKQIVIQISISDKIRTISKEEHDKLPSVEEYLKGLKN